VQTAHQRQMAQSLSFARRRAAAAPTYPGFGRNVIMRCEKCSMVVSGKAGRTIHQKGQGCEALAFTLKQERLGLVPLVSCGPAKRVLPVFRAAGVLVTVPMQYAAYIADPLDGAPLRINGHGYGPYAEGWAVCLYQECKGAKENFPALAAEAKRQGITAVEGVLRLGGAGKLIDWLIEKLEE
jgi:hypothetical protein